jgi:hypothetical protein
MAKRKKKPAPSSGDPTRKMLGKDQPCPCDSGKTYGRCCHGKGFEYLVDVDGNIFKSIPMTDELAEVIQEQKGKFIEKHGREPREDDNLFFDMPPLEHAEHFMVEAMKQAGLSATDRRTRGPCGLGSPARPWQSDGSKRPTSQATTRPRPSL